LDQLLAYTVRSILREQDLQVRRTSKQRRLILSTIHL